SWRWRLYVLTFVESVATILLERGVYFFTTERLGFGEVSNLTLALCFGVAYAVGALASHSVAERVGERRLLLGSLIGLAVVHAGIAAWPTGLPIAVGFTLIGLGSGLKWPVVESFLGAGLDERQMRRALGRFNVTWSTAVPLTVGAAGLLVAFAPAWVFFAAVVPMHAVSVVLALGMPREPEHGRDEGGAAATDAIDEAGLAWRWRLLWSARWLLVGACALAFLIAPLVPEIFARLGQGPAVAGWLAGLLDAARLAVFVVFMAWGGWHGRAWPMVVAMAALPAGTAMVLFGGSVAMVVAGEVLFGLAMGAVYYAALYYALVVKRAAVDAGGIHEALIGGGFAIGPAIGLLGIGMAGWVGGATAGLLVGVLPWVAVTTALGVAGLAGVGPGQRRAAARG
ncbi:MAG: MFS transporter, partial [Planctomycetota bacterium]